METDQQNSEDRVNSDATKVINSGKCIYSVSMHLFHEMYEIFCSKYLGEDEFFESYSEFDPPTPENGMLSLKARYLKWAEENNIIVPKNGHSLH